VTEAQAVAALATPELAPEAAHAGDDHSIRGVRAVFAMAPAIVQAFDPASLSAISTPVAIILGSADPVAPPHTNGGVAARSIPRAQLKALPGVGHYDFLSICSPEARASIPICQTALPQGPTHHEALQMALSFFAGALGPP
jgi:predicted dienelactone hydrolase